MRLVTWFALLILAGCSAPPEVADPASRGTSGVVVRPIPMRTVDGVQVVGHFDAEAVRAITALVQAETSEPLLRIGVPVEPLNAYHVGGAETLSSDVAEVKTGQACDGRCGGGHVFYLALRGGVWVIDGDSIWMG